MLIFNGEIYNYRPLREELLQKGHVFTTKTDSEVLLHGYEEYGPELLNKLRGMFAFAIWDKEKRELFGARDFFGIKPLYYAQMGDTLLFGSEIKSFLHHPHFKKELNEKALESYLSFQYSPGPETFFKNVYKMPPAHYFTYKDGKMAITRYWLPTFQAEEDKSLDYWVDEIEKTFDDSVEAHKISDVEVGSFLSSGVDSQLCGLLGPCGQDLYRGLRQRHEVQRDQLRGGALGADPGEEYQPYHHPRGVLGEFREDPVPHGRAPGGPGGGGPVLRVQHRGPAPEGGALRRGGRRDLRGVQHLQRAPGDAVVRQDPLPHPQGHRQDRRGPARPPGPQLPGAQGQAAGGAVHRQRLYVHREGAQGHSEAPRRRPRPEALTKPYYDMVKDKDAVTKMQFVDLNMWMVGDILLKADKMSMANSLELRVPFLDKKIMALAGRIPTKYRVNDKNTKYAMRLAALRRMPEKWAGKKKLGFPVPTRVWLKEDKYYNIVKNEFESENAKKFFQTEKLVKLLDDHKNGKADNSRRVWTVYTFLVWYQQFFGEDAPKAA